MSSLSLSRWVDVHSIKKKKTSSGDARATASRVWPDGLPPHRSGAPFLPQSDSLLLSLRHLRSSASIWCIPCKLEARAMEPRRVALRFCFLLFSMGLHLIASSCSLVLRSLALAFHNLDNPFLRRKQARADHDRPLIPHHFNLNTHSMQNISQQEELSRKQGRRRRRAKKKQGWLAAAAPRQPGSPRRRRRPSWSSL